MVSSIGSDRRPWYLVVDVGPVLEEAVLVVLVRERGERLRGLVRPAMPVRAAQEREEGVVEPVEDRVARDPPIDHALRCEAVQLRPQLGPIHPLEPRQIFQVRRPDQELAVVKTRRRMSGRWPMAPPIEPRGSVSGAIILRLSIAERAFPQPSEEKP
jgi:hypothetical protein